MNSTNFRSEAFISWKSRHMKGTAFEEAEYYQAILEAERLEYCDEVTTESPRVS